MIILRAIANRNNDLQFAVFDGGRRYAPLSAPLYALCQSHIVALTAAAQPAKHNFVVLCNRGQYIIQLILYCLLFTAMVQIDMDHRSSDRDRNRCPACKIDLVKGSGNMKYSFKIMIMGHIFHSA